MKSQMIDKKNKKEKSSFIEQFAEIIILNNLKNFKSCS